MPTPIQIAWIVVLPALIAAAIGAVSWRVWRGNFSRGFWGGPLAIAIGFAMSFERITETKPWPIHESTTWLFYIALAGGLIGLIDALVRLPTVVRFLLSYAICFASAGLLLRFKLLNGAWTTGQFFATVSSLSIIGLMWWGAFERSGFPDRRINSPTTARRSIVAPLLMWLVATAGALAMNDSLTCSLCAANLAGLSGALAVVSLMRPDVRWMRGTAFAFAPLMLSIIIARNYFTPITPQQQVSISFPLMATPVFILIGRLIAIPIPNPKLRTTVRLVALAIPMLLVMAGGIVAIRHAEDVKKDEGDEMSAADIAWPSKTNPTAYSDATNGRNRPEKLSTPMRVTGI